MLDQGFATGQSIPMTTQWTERIQTSYEAIELWIAASISFAATVVWMARWHFRSVSLRAQILIALGFGGVLPVALAVLVFSTLLIGSNAIEGVLLIFWISVAWVVLLWRGCMQAGASEERRSAMLQVPLFGVWVISKLTPEKFKTHQEKFWAYKVGLRFLEDIPQAIVAGIDLCLCDGSYFAVLDLSLSVLSILAFFSSEPSWRLIKHMSALSVANFVACVVACRGCVVSCIKSLDACVEDVAGRDEEAAKEEEAAEGEATVEGKVLEEEVMTSFTNPPYINPWEVDSVE